MTHVHELWCFVQHERDLNVTAPQLWLATSADRRVSVWSADWTRDFCELVDWLTFPAPAFTPDGTVCKQDDQVLEDVMYMCMTYMWVARILLTADQGHTHRCYPAEPRLCYPD